MILVPSQRTLRFPIRVRYFDDAILEALGAKHAASFSPPWDATPHDAAPRATPQQVVMLGAGMDSRPWRLPLPPGVRWFEIDRVDVLNAKCKALAKAGAALGPTCKDSDACVQVT